MHWNKSWKEYLVRNSPRMSDRQIAAALSLLTKKNFTRHSVQRMRQRLGINKSKWAGDGWKKFVG